MGIWEHVNEKTHTVNHALHSQNNSKVKIVPVVIGVLGTIPKALGKHLDEIGTNVRIDLLQKATLLGTAKILLRKTLKI